MSVDLEAGSLGLGDLERPEILTLASGLGGVVALLLGHGDHSVVLDANDLHFIQVDDRDEVIYGMGLGVVFRIEPYPSQRPAKTPPLLITVAPCRPRIHDNEIHVHDAALP
jgi:hypothetical protein